MILLKQILRKVKNNAFTILLLLLFSNTVYAGHLYLEKVYQEFWCSKEGGITEYTLDDGTRVDCLLPDYAVEFDFGNKWSESIGQSLYYGIKTNKKPAVVLILESEGEQRYLIRLETVAKQYDIKVWIITPKDIESSYLQKQ